jgi:hypothetical protein
LLFESEDTRQFISQSGKQLVICLLKASDKAHQMFEEAYDRMIQWVSDQGNWMTMASELQDRGVRLAVIRHVTSVQLFTTLY